MTENEISPKYW